MTNPTKPNEVVGQEQEEKHFELEEEGECEFVPMSGDELMAVMSDEEDDEEEEETLCSVMGDLPGSLLKRKALRMVCRVRVTLTVKNELFDKLYGLGKIGNEGFVESNDEKKWPCNRSSLVISHIDTRPEGYKSIILDLELGPHTGQFRLPEGVYLTPNQQIEPLIWMDHLNHGLKPYRMARLQLKGSGLDLSEINFKNWVEVFVVANSKDVLRFDKRENAAVRVGFAHTLDEAVRNLIWLHRCYSMPKSQMCWVRLRIEWHGGNDVRHSVLPGGGGMQGMYDEMVDFLTSKKSVGFWTRHYAQLKDCVTLNEVAAKLLQYDSAGRLHTAGVPVPARRLNAQGLNSHRQVGVRSQLLVTSQRLALGDKRVVGSVFLAFDPKAPDFPLGWAFSATGAREDAMFNHLYAATPWDLEPSEIQVECWEVEVSYPYGLDPWASLVKDALSPVRKEYKDGAYTQDWAMQIVRLLTGRSFGDEYLGESVPFEETDND